MQLRVIFLVNVLLCCLSFTCKGTPPDHQSARTKYTDIEDNLILEELSNLLDDRNAVFAEEIWDKVAEKHIEKWKANTPDFPQERSAHGLRSRFRDILIQRSPFNQTKIPDNLKCKIKQAHLRLQEQGKVYKHMYTAEENDFIIEELRKSSITKLFGKTTPEVLRKAHERKRLAKTKGFEKERTFQSLRSQLGRMKRKQRLPKDLVLKFKLTEKESSSSTSTAQNQQTDVQETINDELIDDEIFDDIFKEILNNPICNIDY